MKPLIIKFWIRTTDLGGGSISLTAYPKEDIARAGLDEEGFFIDGVLNEIPCEVFCLTVDASLCEEV